MFARWTWSNARAGADRLDRAAAVAARSVFREMLPHAMIDRASEEPVSRGIAPR
jgi:hypothetical protein